MPSKKQPKSTISWVEKENIELIDENEKIQYTWTLQNHL